MSCYRLVSILGILGLTMVSAISCSNRSSGHSNNDAGVAALSNPGVPDDLAMPTPQSGQELSKDDVAKLKSVFNKKIGMEIPNSSLIFPNRNDENQAVMDAQDLADLRDRDSNSYQFVMDMRQNCRAPHASTDLNATFPTQAPVAFDTLDRGDHGTWTASSAMESGCLLQGSTSGKLSADVLSIDRQTDALSANAEMGASLKVALNNQKYANLIGYRGFSVNYGISGLGLVHEIDIKTHSGKASGKYQIKGVVNAIEGDYPYNMDIQAVVKFQGSGESSSVIVATVSLDVPGVKAQLVGRQTWVTAADGTTTKTSQKYVLNGAEKTEQQLQEIFGDASGAMFQSASDSAKQLN